MSRFHTIFSNRHVVLPVVHVTNLEQALRNVNIAQGEGADGVFLINHSMGHGRLLEIYGQVIMRWPGLWVGVNCLDLGTETVFERVPRGMAGVWTDDGLIEENCQDQPAAEALLATQRRCNWEGLYFGGVAFKYQRTVANLAAVARTAAYYLDVVTTSGPGTGQAAAPEKLRVMREALGEHPLALASGVTPENIPSYLPYVDCFLVATGISRSFDELDPLRVRLLMNAVRRG